MITTNSKTRLSNPILHDIIKSYLNRDAKSILLYCSTIPQLKQSRIFLPTSPHKFYESREEWHVGGMKYPADAVWMFKTQNELHSYTIIHEVKTGEYDIIEEMEKHYISHNHVQFYIWAYKDCHKANKKPPYSFVKQLDILLLRRYITQNITNLMDQWGTCT